MKAVHFVVGTFMVALVLGGAALAAPVVIPAGSTVEGKTIGEWTADW